jgi:thiol-disulfide isomerase/thioredoxin
MKYILLLVLATGNLAAHAQGGAFKIKGTMTGWKGTDSMFLFYTENGKMVSDSTIATNGRFEFAGTIIQPVKAAVSARTRVDTATHTLDHRNFFLDKGSLTITGKDTIRGAMVAGSTVTRDNEKLEQRIAPLFNRFVEIRGMAMKFTKEAQATPEFKALEKEYYEMMDSMQNVRIAFIKANPGSFVSLAALDFVAGKPAKYEKAGPLFENLSPQLRSTPLGKELEQRLAQAKLVGIGAVLPVFESSDTAGNRLKLEDVVKKRKVTLVDFWASWCGPCRKENPNVIRTYTAFHDKGFNIISVSLDKSAEPWKKAIIKDGMPWYHVSELKYWDDPIAKMYGITGIPDNFLLDQHGKVIGRGLRGEALYKKVEAMIN